MPRLSPLFTHSKDTPELFTVWLFRLTASNLATGDESARIWLWDTKTGKKVREFPRDKGHTRGIQAIAFTKDGKRIATVGQDDVIKIWNTSGGHPTHTIKGVGANFYDARFLPTGGLVTATLAEGMRVLRTKELYASSQIQCRQRSRLQRHGCQQGRYHSLERRS